MTAMTWDAAKEAVKDLHILTASRHYGHGGSGKQGPGIVFELFAANAVRSFLFTPEFPYYSMWSIR